MFIKRLSLAAALLAPALIGCDGLFRTSTEPSGGSPGPVRAFRTSDTLQFWEYKAPPAGTAAHRNIVLPGGMDTIRWSTWSDWDGWVHLSYDSTWAFAYVGPAELQTMDPPEKFIFYGPHNIWAADNSAPPYWTDEQMSVYLYDPPHSIIMARKAPAEFPIYVLQPLKGEILPMATNPNDYFQVHTILCTTYY